MQLDDVRPDWHADAMCNTGDAALVDIFFGAGRHDHDGRRAKRICAVCPVALDCLDAALDAPVDPVGVWGGTTADDRRPMRRARAAGTDPTSRHLTTA